MLNNKIDKYLYYNNVKIINKDKIIKLILKYCFKFNKYNKKYFKNII